MDSCLSKKNRIIYMEESGVKFVRKQFADPDCFLREMVVTYRMDGDRAPHAMYAADNFIDMEWIEGRLLMEVYLACGGGKEAYALGKSAGEFFNAFHARNPGVTHTDPNFRNFIVRDSDGTVFGIDLEETGEGDWQDGVARMIAYSDVYAVKKGVKDAFRKGLLETTAIDETGFRPKIKKEREILRERRSV